MKKELISRIVAHLAHEYSINPADDIVWYNNDDFLKNSTNVVYVHHENDEEDEEDEEDDLYSEEPENEQEPQPEKKFLKDPGGENWNVVQKINIPEGFYSGQTAWTLFEVNSGQYTVVTSESLPEGCVPKVGDFVDWSKTTEHTGGVSPIFEDLFGRKWSGDTCGLTTVEGNLTRLFLGPGDLDLVKLIMSP